MRPETGATIIAVGLAVVAFTTVAPVAFDDVDNVDNVAQAVGVVGVVLGGLYRLLRRRGRRVDDDWVPATTQAGRAAADPVETRYRQMYEEQSAEVDRMRVERDTLRKEVARLTTQRDDLRDGLSECRQDLTQARRGTGGSGWPPERVWQNPTEVPHPDGDAGGGHD